MGEEREVQEKELEKLEDIGAEEHRVDELSGRIREVEQEQKLLRTEIENILESDLLKTVSALADETSRINKKLRKLEELDGRVDELENRFILEINSREFDFQRKVDRKELDTRERDIYEELNKLRMSVNVLAEEHDKKEDIHVE